MKYPVSEPYLHGNELKYVEECIKTGWISSQGGFVTKFQEKWAEYNGMAHGVACSSGTTALQLALMSLNLTEGDEVIVPEFTMIASAWACTHSGLKPVFVDCGDDLLIDVSKIEKAITKRTKVIMPVHIYGRQCNMEKIMELAYEYNLKVIEDSCEGHSIKPVGDIACYSLFANKIISAGEGGICLTNDKRLAEQMFHYASMGFNKDHTFLHKKTAHNFRMTNLQAAVALAQVEQIDEILAKRKQIETWYDDKLRYVDGIMFMPKREVLWMYDVLARDRDGLRKFLSDNGIETRVFFRAMSEQPMYFNEGYVMLNASYYARKGLYLPTYPDLTEEDVDFICGMVKSFYKEAL